MYLFSVSKLFRAYGLYNKLTLEEYAKAKQFQSSFELTGYITEQIYVYLQDTYMVSKLFRAYGLYNVIYLPQSDTDLFVSKLFRAYGLYNDNIHGPIWFKFMFQSSFELTGYITYPGKFLMNTWDVSKLFRAYGLYNLCSLEGA